MRPCLSARLRRAPLAQRRPPAGVAARVLLAAVLLWVSGAATAGAESGVLRVLKLRHHEINHPHRDVAGEFRLLSDFAARNGLRIEWQDGVRADELAARLAQGEADMLVADLPPADEDAAQLLPGVGIGAYHHEVFGRRGLVAHNPLQLSGLRVAISLSSPLWPYFMALEHAVDGLGVVVMPDDTTREDLLAGIAAGEWDAAVVPVRPRERPVKGQPRLARLFVLSGSSAARWYFAADRGDLRDALDSYLVRFHARLATPQPAFGDLDTIERRRVLRVITRVDPQNYFLKGGRRAGFEFEMVRMFARERGLATEFLVAGNDQQVLAWLRNGIGDIATTRVDGAQVRADPGLRQSRQYFHAAAVVLGRAGSDALTADTLAGRRVAVLGNSVQHRALGALMAAGVALEAVVLNPGTPLAELAAHIESGLADAAIVDAHAVPALLQAHPDLQAGASLATGFDYAWTARAGDRRLLGAVDDFLERKYRTATYNVLARRYFEQPRYTRFAATDRLSPYDELVRRHAADYDFDWRLIVAQMYQESRFDPAARSSAGAQGLMQLLPATARAVGVSNPFDPDAGIRGGIAYLSALRARFDDAISPRERTWFALAAYNVGFQRVERARAAAAAAGLDPHRWFGHVERIMRNMAREGSGCHCGQTVVYVRAIRSLYNTYFRLQETLTAGLPPARRTAPAT